MYSLSCYHLNHFYYVGYPANFFFTEAFWWGDRTVRYICFG